MADGEITNLSIPVITNVDEVARKFDRLASSAGRLRGAASGAADSIRDGADALDGFIHEEGHLESESTKVRPKIRGTGNDAKTAGENAKKGASGLKTFWESLKRIAFYRAVRSIIREITDSFKTGITNLYQWSTAVDGRFAKSMDTLATSSLYLKNSLGALVAPLIDMLAPAIDVITDKFVDLLNIANQFFSALSGKDSYTAAKKVATTWGDASTKAAGNAKKAADDIKRTILGFDEINKLVKANTSASGSGSGSGISASGNTMFEERPLTGGLASISNAVSKYVSTEIGKINAIIDGSLMAVGLILALSGNLPVGLGLMAMGALDFGASVVAYSDKITPQVKMAIAGVLGIAGIGFAVGAILAFSGGHIGLGIGMMAASVGALGGAYKIASLNWDALSENTYSALKKVMGIASLASLGIGMVLACSGVNPALGLGLIAAGVVGSAVGINWDSMSNDTYNALKKVIGVASTASLGLGLILTLSGVNVPIGLSLIALGVAAKAVAVNWDSMGQNTYSALKKVMAVAGLASLGLGLILALSGVATPLGIGLIAAGVTGVAASINWNALVDTVKGKLNDIKKAADEAWGKLKNGARDMATWVQTKVSTAWTNISTWTSNKWGDVKTTATSIWSNLKTGAGDMAAWVSGKVSGAWDDVKTAMSGFTGWINDVFSGGWEGAWRNITDLFGNVFGVIKDKAKEPINSVIGFLNNLIGKVESAVNWIRKGISNAVKIDIPATDLFTLFGKTVSTPRIYWKPLNLGDVEFSRIQPLANGGILTMPTMLTPNVMGGEAGREAVLPLENNTDWMDTLAKHVWAYPTMAAPNVSSTYESNYDVDLSDLLSLMRQQLDTLRQINDKDTTVEVSTSSVNRAQSRMNRRYGKTIVPVGT